MMTVSVRCLPGNLRHPSLNRYALNAVPPIHSIVKNGNITQEGVVAREGDKNIANSGELGPGSFRREE
jgi:hypothetical protein